MTEGTSSGGLPPYAYVAGTRRPPVPAARDPLAQYPSYLSVPQPSREVRRSPLVSAIGAFAVPFVATMLAAVPIGIFLVAGGMPDAPTSMGEVRQAAAVAALWVIGAFLVVGLLSAWVFLKLRGVRSAFLVAFLGQVAHLILGSLGARMSGTASVLLGAVGVIGVTYALLVWLQDDVDPADR